MNSHPRSHRRSVLGRPALTVTIVLAALTGVGLGGVALANREDSAAPTWQTPAAGTGKPARPGKPVPESAAVESIDLSATGDIVMGSAPDKLPAAGGAGFFDQVRKGLAADLVMGNLEQPLTADTGTSKCGSPPRANCFAFRSPPAYAKHLRSAGFQLLNTANNHSNDYGPRGYRNTVAALEAAGLRHTGAPDQITVVEAKGIKVAVVGFSPYAGANDLNDLAAAAAVVRTAKSQADLVVVQAHMGAEGADRTHVRPGSEPFFGENRGDPIKFSHTVIDAGADLVVGHGPHVLRGMEFYRGKLIAYSLGNFAGGGRTLRQDGALKHAGILHVSLTRDGKYAGGRFLSTYLDRTGAPARDTTAERGRKLVAELSAADFAGTGARIGADGTIKPAA